MYQIITYAGDEDNGQVSYEANDEELARRTYEHFIKTASGRYQAIKLVHVIAEWDIEDEK